MRIGMVFYDIQDFGGAEEYGFALANSLQQQGHSVSILSLAWAPPDNQYLQSLRQSKIKYTQPPKWISNPMSDWPTKDKILTVAMWLLTPLTLLLAVGVLLVKRRSFKKSFISAHGWLRGTLMKYIIGPDYRKLFGRALLNWCLFRWRPDILHIHGYTSNLLFVIGWAYGKKIPVVYEEHQTPDARFGWWIDFERSINKASRVVATSERSAEALRDVCGVTRPIVVRNPIFADPAASGWKKDNISLRTRDRLSITTVARLYVTKGLTYLIEAIAKVNANYPTVQFKVYGDGPLRHELFEYAEQLGLDGEDIFVGEFTRQELPKIMSQTDIFVMASILEGQPQALLEAMAFGCPIVATSVGGIPELIQDGISGFLCMPRDPVCLAHKIQVLIENPDLRHKFSQAARAFYERSPFQPQAVSDHFISIYEEVFQEHKGFIEA